MNESKKNYRLTYGDFDMFFEVDHAVLTEDKLREYMGFWFGGELLISQYGTPFKAYMNMLCREFMAQTVITFAPKNVFDLGNAEGFTKLDGTEGITLITWDDFEFSDDVDIHEETDDEIRSGH